MSSSAPPVQELHLLEVITHLKAEQPEDNPQGQSLPELIPWGAPEWGHKAQQAVGSKDT